MKQTRCRHIWKRIIGQRFGENRSTCWDECKKCKRIRVVEKYSDGSIKRFYPGPEFNLR